MISVVVGQSKGKQTILRRYPKFNYWHYWLDGALIL